LLAAKNSQRKSNQTPEFENASNVAKVERTTDRAAWMWRQLEQQQLEYRRDAVIGNK